MIDTCNNSYNKTSDYNNDDAECNNYINRILISYAPVNETTSETSAVVKFIEIVIIIMLWWANGLQWQSSDLSLCFWYWLHLWKSRLSIHGACCCMSFQVCRHHINLLLYVTALQALLFSASCVSRSFQRSGCPFVSVLLLSVSFGWRSVNIWRITYYGLLLKRIWNSWVIALPLVRLLAL